MTVNDKNRKEKIMFSKEALIKFAVLVAAVIAGNIATGYVQGMLPKQAA